jgi:hypothetical protein
MTKKSNVPEKLQIWIEVRNRYHLSNAQVSMARQLGLNPKKFGKLANYKQEPWKLPLPLYIEELFYKHFKKRLPDNVKSIEKQYKEKKKIKILKQNLRDKKDLENKEITTSSNIQKVGENEETSVL